ncbi:MAG: glycoside hydrolase family 3 protein, partial [Bacteroidaceae bacterium]|nr:glycoside hydrolase family 3 protein [Bacteroidaceae bacterium]
MKKHRTILLNFLGSVGAFAQQYPFQNPHLSAEERAANLCSLLTLDEKVKLMEHGSPAIPRLGIPQFNWWNEALHGVGRNGTATVLPITMAMASTFDDALVQKAYDAVSDEARAKNNIARKAGRCKIYEGLSFWTPNINIFRDPRWGRGQETYGEDPYLTSRMGLAVVRGLQGSEDTKYRKLFACAKHFAVHSGPEWNRHTFNIENLPERDLWETYLPAFKALVQEGNVREVMCAYQRMDGEPCCGSTRYLQHILRDEWGFKGIVTSDCWALNDFWEKNRHNVSPTRADGIAKALIAGTDVECGNSYS